VWSPPHCWGQIYEQEGLVDPIADAAYDITLPVVFDVTGVALGQVTFTLGFYTGTGPSCDPLTFTADVVCCCDVTESEENWHQMGSGSLSDACGNTISTAWDEPSRTYTFYYNSTEVGRCIWDNAINSYQYRKTVDGCRFHSTRHSSSHSHNSPPCTQGCAPIGYYCWKVRYYDCVHDCAGSTFWRRSKTEQGRWGNEGEVCPGH
jgi:hypothetical protein